MLYYISYFNDSALDSWGYRRGIRKYKTISVLTENEILDRQELTKETYLKLEGYSDTQIAQAALKEDLTQIKTYVHFNAATGITYLGEVIKTEVE